MKTRVMGPKMVAITIRAVAHELMVNVGQLFQKSNRKGGLEMVLNLTARPSASLSKTRGVKLYVEHR